ncbi:hypothetical protein C9374_006055 [Naegleria lovaniensis]|uniref:Peroxin-7 n=1 Tax=Naegleria lovaniensis TaxID=51637 RepID=A0AA88GM55_NAELO|nr:uncharacterized protein C9374_006055 [Naegleria lovaniensis]KAG2381671.1 hypothetical protein C9374_006055 [Naegleria lovaniensis]
MNFASVSFSHSIHSLAYSTHYRNVCCVGTFDLNHWYHRGEIHVCHVSSFNKISEDDETSFHDLNEKPLIKQIAVLDNKVGVNKLVWSEIFKELIASANHDGTVTLWNVNQSQKVISILADKGYSISCVDWNQFGDSATLLLVGSTSSRIKLFDSRNFEYVVEQFAEHTKVINDVKWNTNNKDEFASVSDDGLVKIWDKRVKNSINTLLDREQGGSPLKCCDWHKQNDWILAVGNDKGQLIIWDTRNDLQPIQRRQAHSASVQCLSFDSSDVSRVMTGSKDQTLRVWSSITNSKQQQEGIYLTQEHKIHREYVRTVDWNIHNPNIITSGMREYEVEGSLVTEKTRPQTLSKL